jgi:hypothetical protein
VGKKVNFKRSHAIGGKKGATNASVPTKNRRWKNTQGYDSALKKVIFELFPAVGGKKCATNAPISIGIMGCMGLPGPCLSGSMVGKKGNLQSTLPDGGIKWDWVKGMRGITGINTGILLPW